MMYVWIDSLCIVQDSREDWEREPARMEAVYRNSACNIAAADGRNGTEGYLYPTSPRWIEPVEIPVGGKPLGSLKYLVNETDIFEDHPLYSRGWVLQELLIAPRMLNLGKAQLFWDCQELRASKICPEGESDICWGWHPASKVLINSRKIGLCIVSASLLEGILAGTSPARETLAATASHANDAFMSWGCVVKSYSAMKLTKPGDKLVALAGIVSVFRGYLREYLASLWRIWLPMELLWYTPEPASRPDTYRAPSWSWASMDSKIYYEYFFQAREYAPLADAIDVSVTYDNDQKSSLVTGVELRLEC